MPIIAGPDTATHELGTTRFTSLATPSRGTSETSVWRVEMAPGTPATPHQVTREELFVVIEGRARVRIGGIGHEAGPGDTVVVPAATPFEIEPSGDEALHAICCLPVGGQAQLGDEAPFTPPWAV